MIPAGHILGPYDLDSLEMSYLVSISGQTVLPQEILLSIENVLIGGQVANTELISFTITSNRYINFGTPEMVIITISLLEPENLEIFNEIVHHEITYDVVFTIRDMDVIPPTFDPIINQSIEAGSEDIDWSTYIVNPDDNRDVYGD